MGFTLSPREPLELTVEVQSARADVVRELTLDQVEHLPIAVGNQNVPLAERFTVVAGTQSADVVWDGDCTRVKWIGAAQTAGKTLVAQCAGMHTGSGLVGGVVEVRGTTGDWAGAEMRGGQLRIHGDAGNCLGSAYRGAKKGMRGGEILVWGAAGDELGAGMRRGLIAVAGKIGSAAGFGMLAGTIVGLQGFGNRLAAGMKRGTVINLQVAVSEAPTEIGPTFRSAGKVESLFLPLLLRHLERAGFPVSASDHGGLLNAYSGDLLSGGRGELWLRG